MGNNKVHLYEHGLSYPAISSTNKATPHGLLCLKALFEEYDSSVPSRTRLTELFTPDFQDNMNGSDRSFGRDETIEAIIQSRRRCSRHQIDLKHAWCVEHSSQHHTVFFEAVRFMFLEGDTDWTKVPIAGRIEVRIKDNRFSLKDAVAQIATRRLTSDTSHLVKKEFTLSSSPISPAQTAADSIGQSSAFHQSTSNSQTALPPPPPLGNNVKELPASISTFGMNDTKSLPPYTAPSPSESSRVAPTTRTPTLTSGSSVANEPVEKS